MTVAPDSNADRATLLEGLGAAFCRARKNWPEVDWPAPAFEAHSGIVAPEGSENPVDLYLSGAAGFRVAEAWAALEQEARERAVAHLRRYRLGGSDAEDLWRDAIAKLSDVDHDFPAAPLQALGFQEVPAKIARFAGRCSIQNYVLLVAKRVGMTQRQREAAATSAIQELARQSGEVYERAGHSTYNDGCASVERAVREALGSRSHEDRVLFYMVYLQGRSQREGATFLGWSESRASRSLRDTRKAIHTHLKDPADPLSDARANQAATRLVEFIRRFLQVGEAGSSTLER